MKDMHKKFIGLVAAAACLTSTFSLTACSDKPYTQTPLTGYEAHSVTKSAAESNGGFAVKKDGYVYFINGSEEYSADNTFGEVVKGSLMRIAYEDLQSGKYAETETVVPMLFTAQNFDAGIYIYGDYVYYATPTTDKNLSGTVENSWIDFKRAKLDGSETMKDYYFRLEDNASKYRFVEVDGVVYCMYEEDGALKSFNTDTRKTVTLASGIKSESFFYDATDASNPYAYYTMSVTAGADTAHPSTSDYDQLYRVSAAATVSVDSDKASYTVTDKTGGYTYEKTYDFDEAFLEEKNKEFEKTNKNKEAEAPYDLEDYTTYPYVNLGQLVLDGVGKSSERTSFNFDKETGATPVDGYNYTITTYQNGGVYFTRTDLPQTESSGENTKLYFLADSKITADWNAISGNKADNFVTVANDTTNATASAIYTIDKDGNHVYFYVDASGYLQRQTSGAAAPVRIATGLTDNTLWKLDGEYLYFYSAATVGQYLSKINCMADEAEYKKAALLADSSDNAYTAKKLDFVTFNDSWYKPEVFGDIVLYSNAESTGDFSYNYVYAANMKTETVKAQNEAYVEITDYIAEANSKIQNAMTYYFRTGETAVYEDLKSQYSEYRQDDFDEFVAKFTAEEFKLQSAYTHLVGEMKSEDKDSIKTHWTTALTLESTTEEGDKEGLATWAIVLIVVGSVLVVAAAVLIPVLVVSAKKRAKKRADEATVNAYKRKKIDTTDDKSIDVYADDDAEEAKEAEATEATAETEAETPVEAPVEEATEAEATEEKASE